MSHIVFWAEPAVLSTSDATITVGAGEVDGGRHDGAERVALVVHTRSASGDITHGSAHLTAAQVTDLIVALTDARDALETDISGIGGTR